MSDEQKKIEGFEKSRKKADAYYKEQSPAYRAFQDLAKQAFRPGVLEKRVKEMIAIAISTVVKCEPCIEHHVREALQDGATEEQIVEAIEVAFEMGGGPATVQARFALDRKDHLPAYRQIARRIEKLIETEAIGEGDILPPTRRLARQLNVSRYTVYCAYQELWARGFLVSTPGSYSRVRARAAGVRIGRSGHEVPATTPVDRLIDLGAYRLDEGLFPMRDLRRALQRVSRDENASLLHYGTRRATSRFGRPSHRACAATASRPGRRTFSSRTARSMAWTSRFACSPVKAGESS